MAEQTDTATAAQAHATETLTTLLDATRLGALEANRRGGPLFATVTRPDAAGTAYTTSLVEIGADSALPLTRGSASVGALAAGQDGSVFFTTKRPGDEGNDPDDPALFWLPARGEARKLAEHPGGFDAIAARPGLLVAQVPLHSQATTEAEHGALSKQRKDAKVSATLHSGFPIRYWNHDLGPARDVLAVATLPDNLATAPETAGPDASALNSSETPNPPEDPPRSVLHFSFPRMPDGRLLNWTVAPDGDFAIVTVETTQGSAATGGTRLQVTSIYRVDLRGDTEPVLLVTSDPDWELVAGEISPDGGKLIYERDLTWTATTTLTPSWRVLELATGYDTQLWADHDYWIEPVWLDDHTIAATSDDQGRGSVWVGQVDDAAPRRLAGGPEQRFAFSNLLVRRTPPAPGSDPAQPPTAQAPTTPAGRELVAAASAVDTAPFPVAIDPGDGAITPLPNPATDLRTPGELREVHTTAADGAGLRAWLLTPDGPGPHPLLVFAHGGPWGSWNAWTFRWNPGPFVADGYAVLLPDPAISTGYGQAMIERGQHQLGGTPYTDILALTDAATELPAVDKTRTALAGGSYGGYMANWMAGHTDHRFKCIVSHASLWNTEVMGKTTDNSGWDESMAQQHATYSPHLFADRIAVPMLVIHGDRDYRCPIGQSEQLWMDLLTKSRTELGADGQTRHRFLYFPDEGHWILGRGNAQVWYETVLAFADRHVRGLKWQRPATLG